MMRLKYLVLAAALALALPLAADARGPNRGLRGDSCGGCGGGFGGLCGGKGGLFAGLGNAPAAFPQKNGLGFFQPPFQAAPWYLYWPYDAHFQLPAPIGAPFQPPHQFNTPWNPYFAHPAHGMGSGHAAPHGYIAPPPG